MSTSHFPSGPRLQCAAVRNNASGFAILQRFELDLEQRLAEVGRSWVRCIGSHEGVPTWGRKGNGRTSTSPPPHWDIKFAPLYQEAEWAQAPQKAVSSGRSKQNLEPLKERDSLEALGTGEHSTVDPAKLPLSSRSLGIPCPQWLLRYLRSGSDWPLAAAPVPQNARHPCKDGALSRGRTLSRKERPPKCQRQQNF